MKPGTSVRVWDPLLRILHWLLVATTLAAWITTSHWTRWHEVVGKAVLAVVAVRLVWGFVGPHHARFASFVRSPRDTVAYSRLALRSREARHIGHNPLGAWMVIALLAGLTAICASGWLFTTDMYWGSEAVSTFHEIAAWTVLGLIACHIAGVVATSFRHRENLVVSMLSGRKRSARPDDIA